MLSYFLCIVQDSGELLHVTVQISQHHLYWRASPFPIVYSWLLCCKWLGLLLGSLFCSIDPYFCFYVSHVPFDYYSFVILFGIREHDASIFVLLSQCCFGYLVPFWFNTNFSIIALFLWKNTIEIWWILPWVCRLLWVAWRF